MLESDPLVLPPVSELFALERSLPLTNEGTEERRELKNFPYADGYSKKNSFEANVRDNNEDKQLQQDCR